MSEQLIDEFKLPSGFTYSLCAVRGGFEVDCWNAKDENHWHRSFEDEVEARKEFERWRK